MCFRARATYGIFARIHGLREDMFPVEPGRGTVVGARCSKARPFIFPTCWPTRNTPGRRRRIGWRSHHLGVPMLREGVPIGVFSFDARDGAAVHREADRAGHHLRRPGGDRDRERAAVRRNPGEEPSARGSKPAQVTIRLQHEPRAAHAAQRDHRSDRDDGHQRSALRYGKGAGAAAAREPRRNSPAWPHQSGARPVEDRSRET